MRERVGWQCAKCGWVILEYRRKRADACPSCFEPMSDECEVRTVAQFDSSDFPKKSRVIPGQMDLFESTRAQLAAELSAQDDLLAPFTVED